MIVTFYSFKGGVGRSMALANVAELLAQRGYSVIACDWDLEAPGLEHYLEDRPEALTTLLDKPGVVDLIAEYKDSLAHPMKVGDAADAKPPAGFRKVGDCLLREPHGWAEPLPRDTRQTSGSVRFLPAGRRGGEWKGRYERAVTSMDWADFYAKWSGGSYFEFFREDLNAAADIVLIDSRTGVTELGGICTHHLADMVFVLTAPNHQNLEGTQRMMESLRRPQVQAYRHDRPLCLLPIASRVDTRSQVDEAQSFKSSFHKAFDDLANCHLKEGTAFLELSLIPYVSLYSYVERVVARQPAESRNLDLLKPYLAIADAIVEWGTEHAKLPQLQVSTDSATRVEIEVISKEREYAQQSVLRSEFCLAWDPGERKRAMALVRSLRSAGMTVWCDAMPDSSRHDDRTVNSRLDAIERSVGYLLLVGASPDLAWLEAEANAMLALWAVKSDYRPLVVNLGPPFASDLLIARIPSIGAADDLPVELFAGGVLSAITNSRAVVHESADGADLKHLASPDAAHARYLLGRNAARQTLLTQVEGMVNSSGFALAVLGDWSTGKSSMMRAGLVSALHRGLITRNGGMFRAAYVWLSDDDADPVWAVFMTLARIAQTHLSPSAPGDADELFRWLERSSEQIILIVDNAERLTLTEWAEKRQKFVACVERMRIASAGRLFLVLSERTSEWKKLKPLLPAAWGTVQTWELPMVDKEGIFDFLLGGAKLTGITWEADALERAVNEGVRLRATPRTVGQLLQEVLAQREGNLLTFRSYVRLGGIGHVIALQAEKSLTGLAQDRLKVARQIILRLVPVGPRPVRTLSTDDLSVLAGQSEAEDVFLTMVDRGVLQIEESTITLRTPQIADIELVKAWRQEEFAKVMSTARLEQAVANWLDSGRENDETARGTALRTFRKVAPLLAKEREFLKRSERVRRIKMALLGITILGSIAGMYLCVWAFRSERRAARLAQESTQQAKQHETQRAALAQELIETKARLDRVLEENVALKNGRQPDVIPKPPNAPPSEAYGDPRSDLIVSRPPVTPTASPDPSPAQTTPGASLPTATPSKPAPDRFYTKDLTVEYFAKQADGSKVVDVLGSLGVKFVQRTPHAAGIATNVLAYGQTVDQRDVFLLAKKLIDAGVSISSIHAIRGTKQSKPLIQVSSYYNAQQLPAYTVQELQKGSFRSENAKVMPPEVGVLLDHDSQKHQLLPVYDALNGESYNLRSVKIAPQRDKVTETVVRYFSENDAAQANYILSVLQSAGVRDGRPSFVPPAQAPGSQPGTFEIWLSPQAFGEVDPN